MAQPTKTSRREFLQGRSATEALGDAVIGPPPELPPPEAARAEGTYLLAVSREAMACEFEILLPTHRSPHAPREEGDTRSVSPTMDAALAALDLIEQLEDQLTVFRDTSEVAAINRRAANEAVAVEARLFELLVRALGLYHATGGAFDITAGPLSKVWGFYRRQGRLPSADEVSAALALVGSDKLDLDQDRQTIRFHQQGMELNLGAIGKGYALDRAAESMLGAGAADFAIHGGNSSVIARGHRIADSQSEIRNPKSEIAPGWSVALRHPLKPDVRLAEFRLVNQALGTSGSGAQFFHHQGRRYGHILDPRTGWPAEHVLSATVIAPTAELADALSTAFYVMGLAPAREFCASRPEIAAVLVTTAVKAGTVVLHPLNLADDAWQHA
jgi:thiamine biosynthesis lipoprotein